MRPSLPRILAGVAGVATLALCLGACDTAPYAASVDGHTILETGLNAELRQLSANGPYIAAVDDNSSGSKVAGAAPGTYTTAWTAYVLTDMVVADAVHRYLAAHHRLPDRAMVTAARTVEATDYSALWSGFSASYQATLTDRLADLAQLEPISVSDSDLDTAYNEYRDDFFTRVCVRTAAVSARTKSEAKSEADQLESAINSAAGGAAGSSDGTVTCYTPADLEQQAQRFVSTVLKLAAGKAANPLPTSYGYEVVAVDSRTLIPLDSDLKRAISAVIESGDDLPSLEAVLAKVRVKVNPAYGRWAGSESKGYAIVAPKAPKT